MPLIRQFIVLALCVCCGLFTSQTLGSTTADYNTTESSDVTNATTVSTPVSTTANDVWCYSCSDTVRGAECQKNLKTMAKEAGNTQVTRDGPSNWEYAKNCKGYHNFTYCMIESIENRGEVHSYRRDCSDGVSFSYDADKFKTVRPDNQTTCAYNLQGYVVCVRLCLGDFCNGPFPIPSANTETRGSCLLILFLVSFFAMFGE